MAHEIYRILTIIGMVVVEFGLVGLISWGSAELFQRYGNKALIPLGILTIIIMFLTLLQVVH